ncbi:hypothetical protein Plav_1210 [Parvibaculum lavamentivorans DS-1]|uniref:Uncharacterized protein n=1 Tax=Parvibaculum lavamentivorans (strain DS-1 / DSM 13023 / NCIMB 13966) TaxID=402881 RepID=A7HSE7_PARL1|nr:hypothetical protein Plav_1210 [Parvibaculum lavamentivorans DS-1]
MALFCQLKEVAEGPCCAGADLLIRAIEALSSVKRRVCGLAFAVKLEERAFGVTRLFGTRICVSVRFEQEGGPDLSAGAS